MGKFQVGNPGKPKGAVSKRLDVREMLESKGINVFDEILALLPKLNPSMRVRTLLEIAKFGYPTLKSSEIQASVETHSEPKVRILIPANGTELIDHVNVGAEYYAPGHEKSPLTGFDNAGLPVKLSLPNLGVNGADE